MQFGSTSAFSRKRSKKFRPSLPAAAENFVYLIDGARLQIVNDRSCSLVRENGENAFMSVAAKLKKTSSDDRSAERYRLRISTVGEASDRESLAITIHDLSTSGFLIETSAPLAIGAEITVELPGIGKHDAQILWTNGHFCGGTYAMPLSRAETDAVLAASPVILPYFRDDDRPDPAQRAQVIPDAPPPPIYDLPVHKPEAEAGEEELSWTAKFAIIGGLALLLWAMIGAAAWFALG